MNFEQAFANTFGDKYTSLFLKNVLISKQEGVCIFTFFYPSSCENLTDAQKNEIINWIKTFVDLEGLSLKVKFMKVYIEEKLIKKFITELITEKYKLLAAYVKDDDLKININEIDVGVEIDIPKSMCKYVDENNLQKNISNDLKENFLTNFIVKFNGTENVIDDVDIESVPLVTKYKVTKRYNIEIIKDIIGKSTLTRPKYISEIKGVEVAALVAGFISNITRKEFTIKSGKRIGEKKGYYTFTLTDDSGKIDCIYFCPKTNEKRMSALEELMYVVIKGDVKIGLSQKLTLHIEKIALASKLDDPIEVLEEEPQKEREWDIIENISSTEQVDMFNMKKYNDKIMGKTIVVFDLETTGLDSEEDEIIELGAVKVVNGQIVEKFNTFVKPEQPIPEEASNINHITDDMVEDAPPIEYVIKKFYDFCDGAILCGHNVVGFDIKFVKRFGDYYDLSFDHKIIDTIEEVKKSSLGLARVNLGAVTKALGIELVGAHRAWNDAFATAKVLLKLNEL